MEAIKQFSHTVREKEIRAYVGAQLALKKTKDILSGREGTGVSEHGGLIIGAIVIVLMAVGAILMLFKDKIIPGVTGQIDKLFTMS